MRYISTFTDTNLTVGVASDVVARRQPGVDWQGDGFQPQQAEDYVAFEIYGTPGQGPVAQVAVVASGEGFSDDVAAATDLVVNAIYMTLQHQEQQTDEQTNAGLPNALSLDRLIASAVARANEMLIQALRNERITDEIGVAVTLVALAQNRLYLATVGRGGVYLVRQGTAHSLTANAVAMGADASTPLLGQQEHVTVTTKLLTPGQSDTMADTVGLELAPDDLIVLCTPGLRDHVPAATIATTVATGDAQEAAWALADMAKASGRAQSYTALILQRSHRGQARAFAPTARAAKPRGSRRRRKTLLALLCLLVVIVGWPLLAPAGELLPEPLRGSLPTLWLAAQDRLEAQMDRMGRAGQLSVGGAAADGTLTNTGADQETTVTATDAEDDQLLVAEANLETVASVDGANAVVGGEASTRIGPDGERDLSALVAVGARLTGGDGFQAVRGGVVGLSPELAPIFVVLEQIAAPHSATAPLVEDGDAAEKSDLADVVVQSARLASQAAPTLVPPTLVPPTPTPIPPTPTPPPPTVTPVPPTPVPPTRAPTATQRPRTARRTATPTVAPTATANVPDFSGASVTLVQPQPGDTLNGKRAFSWRANFAPPPGYAFEVIFWQRGQDPLAKGKGYAGSTTGTQLNVEWGHFRMRNAPEGEYRWGVILIQTEPYQRIKFLGGDQLIYVQN